MKKLILIFVLFCGSLQAQMVINPYAFGNGYTARTQAFISATGIVDNTIIAALNTLDLGLIANGLDSKMVALYPMVGGTATTHKYNFMDARDLDAAFRLTFNGGWTHSSTGAKPNGSTGYADTHLTPSSSLNQNSSHLSYYSRTTSNGTEVEIGCAGALGSSIIEIRTAGTSYFKINTATFLTYTDSDSKGFYVANRSASNVTDGWKNGVKVATGSTASTQLPGNLLYLAAYSQGGAVFFSTKECAFSTIGSGFTDAESLILYNLIQAFQTSLSRQV